MSNPYDEYQIDIVDVSRWQDDLTTPFKPNILQLVAAGIVAIVVRFGLGRVKDVLADWFWSTSKGLLARLSYWYGDYYSHRALGISDRAWGIEQGTNWAKYMKGDWGEGKGFLDCEPSSGHPIGILQRKSYNEIMRPLAETFDSLTGGECGIYSSPGFIPNLYEWARKRTLWVAWYDRSKTKEQVIAECRKKGWLGEIVIWQYASDGDINMDGIGDGRALGMETSALDLNAWLGTAEEWSRFLGNTPPIVPLPNPPTEDEVIVPEIMRLFYPLDEGVYYISQKFGVNPQKYTISKGHNGVDWGVSVGKNVYAMRDGEVTTAEALTTGYGRHVRIKHSEGVSIYGHLSKLLVKQGDIVKAGQLIGLSGGATSDPYCGWSTGPHLHAEFRLDSGAPQVPGGYVYGAIDILPLLVSHSYAGEDVKPLYSISMIYDNLIVKAGPGSSYSNLRNAGLGVFGIYEEKNGFGRIHKFISEWVNLDPKYSIRVEDEEPPIDPPPTEDPVIPTLPTVPAIPSKMIANSPWGDGLNVRNKPKNLSGTLVEKWMPQGTEIVVLEVQIIGSDIWIRIGFNQWVALKYDGVVYLK